ncbi:MAG TPA: hypothetical protein PLJ47_17455 [Candidatus Hydrogenedentes bacterium]|nr:hypothetical protein [Candidatus Hydrogenedentota bacterium]
MQTKCLLRGAACLVVTVYGALSLPSCGYIADKDRIKIATLNGKAITRGDFDKVIREMAPDERPLIRTKGDVRKALENYLDAEVRNQNAEALLEQQKIFVPREIAEQMLRFKRSDLFIEIARPEDYKLNERDIEYMKEEREIKIDEEWRKLHAEAGVQYRIDQAIQEGLITITDEEYQSEFAIRSGTLIHYERVAFKGILVPGGSAEARTAGTEIRQRLQKGETPEAILPQYESIGAQIIESELDHDPAKTRYASFWEQAENAQPGQIVGPIAIKGWVAKVEDAQGRVTENPYPDGMLVCVVTDRTDEKPKTLEESKPQLQFNILYAKIMDQMRTENGVQIIEENLPDPGMYTASQ